MKAILTLLLLALASLALPSSSAALPIQCTAGPTAPGGDTHCEGEVVDCDVLVHVYDTEDALNHYKVACGCVAYDNYGRPAFRFDCYTPPPIATSSAAVAPPELPCYTGIAGSWCTVGALDCKATVGYRTGSEPYPYAGAYCGPHLWYPCMIVYVDTLGNLESCYLTTASASDPMAAEPCTAGFAQTWCDFTVGPCDLRVTPWTAWGDQSVVADCSQGITRCHAEVHTQDPTNPEQWCAF